MAFKLRAVTDTRAVGDDEVQRRYVYVDKTTGKSMSLLAPLHDTDDVARILGVKPTRQHVERNGQIRVVTTWSRPSKHATVHPAAPPGGEVDIAPS